MTMAPESKGKLGVAGGEPVTNGPEGASLGWDAVDWRACEERVRRLRQRIFTASQAGDLKRVRNLQKLMLRSRANTLLSVRRVSERNAGRETAGIDGEVALTPRAKMKLAERVQCNRKPLMARPVKRVYIPKKHGSAKLRPLGIPVIVDRVHQARIVNALEPEWEARFEPKSYGFRPGRGCHDAIEAIYHVANGKSPRRRWVLDADLAAAFDRLDHPHILRQLGTFPRTGNGQAMVEGRRGRARQVNPDQGGSPSGRCGQPVAVEHRAARDGKGRRGPLLHDRR
jgi:RNA-directed DNA polymerase